MDKELNIITSKSCGQLTGVLNYGVKEIPLENIGLEDLQGVEINNLQEEDILIYKNGKWINEQRFNSGDVYILNGGNAIE